MYLCKGSIPFPNTNIMIIIRNTTIRAAFIGVAALLLPATAAAQTRQTKQEYIARYKSLAIDHMERYGIPASITMAQGILESDCGNSSLALRSNNHFGIKCKRDWTGDRVYHDDDEKGECFREYESVEDSYIDHSEFLDKQPRYDSLFVYEATDYRSWARGLKAAGYATAPDYADRLIRLIEDNRLDLLDRSNGAKLYDDYMAGVLDRIPVDESICPQPSASVDPVTPAGTGAGSATVIGGRDGCAADHMTAHDPRRINPDTFRVTINSYGGYNVYMANTAHYVIAKRGDTYRSIGRVFDIAPATLRRFNDAGRGVEPAEGDIVYIDRKPSHWKGEATLHVAREGETLLALAQWYGIRLKPLAKMNRARATDRLVEGQTVRLK